eukprot:gene10604-11750_t
MGALWSFSRLWSFISTVRTYLPRIVIVVVIVACWQVVDHFKGGQRCDENGHERSVEVHIQCCDGLQVPNSLPSEMYFRQDKNDQHIPKASLTVVEEPQLCHYLAVVCSPLLCPQTPLLEAEAKHNTFSSGSGGKHALRGRDPASLEMKVDSRGFHMVDLMRLLENTCLVHTEDWWSYEVCFSKGIRQVRFNIEQVAGTDGNVVQKQVLASQFFLGQPPLSIYKNETALQSHSSAASKLRMAPTWTSDREQYLLNHTGLLSPLLLNKNRDPIYLSLPFTNGTPCDLDNVNRSTTLDIFCGTQNQILQVIEERTCAYRIKVELKVACQLPGFLPEKEKVTTLAFTLFDQLEGEEEKEQKEEISHDGESSSDSAFPQGESSIQDNPILNEVQTEEFMEESSQTEIEELVHAIADSLFHPDPDVKQEQQDSDVLQNNGEVPSEPIHPDDSTESLPSDEELEEQRTDPSAIERDASKEVVVDKKGEVNEDGDLAASTSIEEGDGTSSTEPEGLFDSHEEE